MYYILSKISKKFVDYADTDGKLWKLLKDLKFLGVFRT